MKESVEKHVRVIILGSGPAGYTAAIYAARANLSPLMMTGIQPGGQLMTTTDVGNWPGGAATLQGPELMESMQQQVMRLGVLMVQDTVKEVRLKQYPFYLKTEQNKVYTSETLIIATGARAKYLGLPSESAFQGRGVSACATCDGFLYRNQIVAVVGGGNTALEEALYLSHIAKKTILIHRKNTFRAEKILQDKLFERVKEGSIELQLNKVVDIIEGNEQGVTGLKVKDIHSNQWVRFAVQCVFIAIGHHPNTELFEGQLALKEGYITLCETGPFSKNKTATSIPGVFAAGDVADPIYRQAITAAATGCMAALDVEKYLDQ